MFSKLGKIVGGIFAVFVVLALIGACFGDESSGGGSSSYDAEYNAWFKKECPKCILEKEQKYEMDRVSKAELAHASRCSDEPYPEFNKALKIVQIVRTYKVKDEYKPEQEWERKIVPGYAVTLLSMPKGVEKVEVRVWAISKVRGDGYFDHIAYYGSDGSVEFDFSGKQTQKQFAPRLNEKRVDEYKPFAFVKSSALQGHGACVTFKEVK